jgi:hypothetical protein
LKWVIPIKKHTKEKKGTKKNERNEMMEGKIF